jgi:hypothetical protein
MRKGPQFSPQDTAANAHVYYNGGPVLGAVKVVSVLYGSGTYVPAVSTGFLSSFYAQVTRSNYLAWLSEYDTPTQNIGLGSFAGQVSITPSAAHAQTNLMDTDVEAELGAQIKAGALPAPDANTVYMVSFPKGDVITSVGGASCVVGGFCAYHASFTYQGKSVYYGVLPDNSPDSGCDTGCGVSADPVQNLTSTASHELAEAITDPAAGVNPAWYDSVSGEIGDICQGQQGTFTGTDGVAYGVQALFSEQESRCILAK